MIFRHGFKHRRLTAMRMALWAARQPTCPTPKEIASQFGISLNAAEKYRKDYLAARMPPAPQETRHG